MRRSSNNCKECPPDAEESATGGLDGESLVKILNTLEHGKLSPKFAIFEGKLVGKGANSMVKKGVRIKNPEDQLAVKIVQLKTEGARERVYRELAVACRLPPDCEHIVRIERQRVESHTNAYIFMQYCDGGTLAKLLHKPSWDPTTISRLFRELASGYEALYRAGVLHEDIKPDNVLIHRGTYKIADFGLARILETERHATTKRRGTLKYMAPEKLIRKEYVGDVSSDVYSMGVMFFEAATGKHPYFDQDCLTAGQLTDLTLPIKHREALKHNCCGCPSVGQMIIRMICRYESDRVAWTEVYKLASLLERQKKDQSLERVQYLKYYPKIDAPIREVRGSRVQIECLEPLVKSSSKAETADTEHNSIGPSEYPSLELMNAIELILKCPLRSESAAHKRFWNKCHDLTLSLKRSLLKKAGSQEQEETGHPQNLTAHSKNRMMKRVFTIMDRSDLSHEQSEAVYTSNMTRLIEPEMALLENQLDTNAAREIVEFIYQVVYLMSAMSPMPHSVQPIYMVADIHEMKETIEDYLNKERQLRFSESMEAAESEGSGTV